MKNLVIILKILASVATTFGVISAFIMGIAIASSSHNIPVNERENAILNGKIALIIGPILITCIWLPWVKWFRKK